MDVYRDMATRDKLIFPLVIMWIIRHSSIPYPKSSHFIIIYAISAASIQRSEAQLRPKLPQTKTVTPPAYFAPSTFTPFSSSMGDVMLEAIMAQLKHVDAHLDTLIIELN